MNLVCRAFLYTVCYVFFTIDYLYITIKVASLERYFVSYPCYLLGNQYSGLLVAQISMVIFHNFDSLIRIQNFTL